MMVSISKPGGVRRLKKYGSVSARFSSSSYRSRMSWKVVGAWFSESLKIESSLYVRIGPRDARMNSYHHNPVSSTGSFLRVNR